MPPNQREVQRQLMAKYNIFFDVPIESEVNPRWPRSFNQIFQAVRELGKRGYAEYSETITANITQAPWKAQAQLRAECVRKKVKQCLDARKNESGWRTSLENRIMARFDTEIACRNCRNRLWRSELEATATSQSGADDRNSLRARQSRRQPCQCNGGGGALALPDNGISPIFDDRAEQGMVCSPALQVELPKREVRPDRVYGLQTTKRFGRLLGLTPGVRTNPFKPDGEPLIFPFLVIEAKSEKAGYSNSDIQLQTGFAIRELLMIQHELGEAASEDGNWHGGPLVWFISYRGEDWRVSAAFIHKKDDEISYRVVRLWQGCLDSLDNTLQLLLIIDYIADWARDIYREGIAGSLQKLANSDSASLAHDEDIQSKASGLRSRASSFFDTNGAASQPSASRAPSHFDPDPVPRRFDVNQEASKLAVTADPLRHFDHHSGVFRDARFIQSKFIGLIITHENVEEFLSTSTTRSSAYSLISGLLLQLQGACLVKGHMLNYLELLWTDTQRNPSEMSDTEELFYTIITVTFYLSRDWEPTREMVCLAVSQKLVQDLVQASATFPDRHPFLLTSRSSPHVSRLGKCLTVESLDGIAGILHMSAENSLIACLCNFSLRTHPESYGVTECSGFVWTTFPTAYTVDGKPVRHSETVVLRSSKRPSARSFVRNLYFMYRIGRNEPNISFLRASSTMDQFALPKDLARRPDILNKGRLPWTDDPRLKALRESNEYLIIARQESQDIYFEAKFCIFILDASRARFHLPIYDTSRPPSAYILIKTEDDNYEHGHRSFIQQLEEADPGWSVDLGVQFCHGLHLLIEHLDLFKEHLKRSLGGVLSVTRWEEVTKALFGNQDTNPFDIASSRPFKRQNCQKNQKSILLELGWDGSWIQAQNRRRRQVNTNSRDGAFTRSTAGPANRTNAPIQGLDPSIRHDASSIVQADQGQLDPALMSERRKEKRPIGAMGILDEAESSVHEDRRRGKRPMGAVDESDEAESSAHAERRARQEREVGQRFNRDFLSDQELEEVLANGALC